ncbi:hypothetical protein NQ318_008839 [Aromia moschata]|uniref:Uncharacterized protein n=1 Tax=Aromia moschata TaxID=1265417 RepID=A0AAV8ZC17_9CUCU|nr:hypothetical protein NQ318_008839 [Aromia moschata]
MGLTRNFLIRYVNVDPILTSISFVEFVFFICGSVWAFKNFEPSYNPEDGILYCNKTAFLFAFIYICCCYMAILVFILIAFLLCCLCLMTMLTCSCNDIDDDATVEAKN